MYVHVWIKQFMIRFHKPDRHGVVMLHAWLLLNDLIVYAQNKTERQSSYLFWENTFGNDKGGNEWVLSYSPPPYIEIFGYVMHLQQEVTIFMDW